MIIIIRYFFANDKLLATVYAREVHCVLWVRRAAEKRFARAIGPNTQFLLFSPSAPWRRRVGVFLSRGGTHTRTGSLG